MTSSADVLDPIFVMMFVAYYEGEKETGIFLFRVYLLQCVVTKQSSSNDYKLRRKAKKKCLEFEWNSNFKSRFKIRMPAGALSITFNMSITLS